MRSGLPVSNAVFATASTTTQMATEWSVAHSLPLCISESRVEGALSDGEELLGEGSGFEFLVESIRVWIDPEPFDEVLGVEPVAEELPPCLLLLRSCALT